ncbi:MAG: hypothetical protein A2Z99_13685 [Treponema sp. GWB1_62_6]|nr:MAG: hypothetical protein A2Y36_07800 [Treponema sp. GWA1_62_8]OHE64950.1 MAG: hypothetical protein A2Z99_13685 [Treponema sp. GWB1_62_6]OHE67011.1 MAG: hypothetical protein A2001_08180 [Treponema sp. GWC1_61_84]OHE70923.1 MAG: hypothetical protein A2413_13375 [Treponema sp. RIFOXYC1_FULL_61_9]HCM27366.1 competence protein [Treponema sp.]
MISEAAEDLYGLLKACSFRLAAAESCTTGSISVAFAEIPGASKVFWGSFVCYSNDAKSRMLGIDEAIIRKAGAASGEVALAMAEGILAASGADYAVATTGVAGPEGDGTDVPIGTVWLAVVRRAERTDASSGVTCRRYEGDRNAIRDRATEDALRLVAARIRKDGMLSRDSSRIPADVILP